MKNQTNTGFSKLISLFTLGCHGNPHDYIIHVVPNAAQHLSLSTSFQPRLHAPKETYRKSYPPTLLACTQGNLQKVLPSNLACIYPRKLTGSPTLQPRLHLLKETYRKSYSPTSPAFTQGNLQEVLPSNLACIYSRKLTGSSYK